jgi:hypothetical protein
MPGARWAERRYRAPEHLLARFHGTHPEIDSKQLRLVSAGLVQWILIERRWPHRHLMPSLAVLEFAEVLRADAAAWADCVRTLQVAHWDTPPYPPTVSERLLATVWHAQELEFTLYLPVLFDVDRRCRIRGGHWYQTTLPSNHDHICPHDVLCIHWEGPYCPPMMGMP